MALCDWFLLLFLGLEIQFNTIRNIEIISSTVQHLLIIIPVCTWHHNAPTDTSIRHHIKSVWACHENTTCAHGDVIKFNPSSILMRTTLLETFQMFEQWFTFNLRNLCTFTLCLTLVLMYNIMTGTWLWLCFYFVQMPTFLIKNNPVAKICWVFFINSVIFKFISYGNILFVQ